VRMEGNNTYLDPPDVRFSPFLFSHSFPLCRSVELIETRDHPIGYQRHLRPDNGERNQVIRVRQVVLVRPLPFFSAVFLLTPFRHIAGPHARKTTRPTLRNKRCMMTWGGNCWTMLSGASMRRFWLVRVLLPPFVFLFPCCADSSRPLLNNVDGQTGSGASPAFLLLPFLPSFPGKVDPDAQIRPCLAQVNPTP
jgi:hypothetical protein